MYYFKDNENGIGTSSSQNLKGDITWITKEEFDELLALHEQEKGEND